jgi:hypothetical protein
MLGVLTIVYFILFMVGIIISARMAGQQYRSPFLSEDALLEFFRSHADAVRIEAVFVFASAVSFGMYAVETRYTNIVPRNNTMNTFLSPIERPDGLLKRLAY